MSIVTAKMNFYKYGVHAASIEVPGTLILPELAIKVSGKRTMNRVSLEPNRFQKTDYKGIAICENFLAVIISDSYILFDEEGKEHATIIREEAGEIIGVQPECVLLVKGTSLRGYGVDGDILGERELTQEEINVLKK